MAGRFVDRVALVTGAARGMGRAVALALAGEGAKVALNDLQDAYPEELEEVIRRQGGEALAVAGDVSQAHEVQRMVALVVESYGRVDILVNNAGVLRSTSPLESIPVEEWDRVLDVNLKGAFLCTREVLPLMKRHRYGKIVNISSSAGRSTSELGGAHYTASKAGLLGLSRHTARECGPWGICVNAICPGLVDTPMIHEMAGEERLTYWRGQIPLGRFAVPDEEADLVLFLASEQARYITGATIDFNGGSVMM